MATAPPTSDQMHQSALHRQVSSGLDGSLFFRCPSADNLHSWLESVGTRDVLEKYIMRFVRSRNGKSFMDCIAVDQESGPDRAEAEAGSFTRSDWVAAVYGRNDIQGVLRNRCKRHIVVWEAVIFLEQNGLKASLQADRDDSWSMAGEDSLHSWQDFGCACVGEKGSVTNGYNIEEQQEMGRSGARQLARGGICRTGFQR